MSGITHRTSIRSRILLPFLTIILIGFALLTIVAGQQISVATRNDYERELINTTRIIAQGLRPIVTLNDTSDNISDELASQIEIYEAQTNVEIQFLRSTEEEFLEILPFSSGFTRSSQVIQHQDDDGIMNLYTVQTIIPPPRGENPARGSSPPEATSPALLVVRTPYSTLTTLIAQRWGTLLAIVFGISTLTSLVSFWLSASITQPLKQLRDGATLLSQGDLSHRIKDMTSDEIGEVAQAFNDMAQQVQNMLEEQRAFASNTSHELRTPLTSIRLRSEALRYETLDAQTTADYIAGIDDEVIHLSALIDDLTLLSRLDANRAELGQSEIDFVRFAQYSIQTMHTKHPDKSIDLHAPDNTHGVTILSSFNHLTVIFRNILNNAIKYSGDDAQIDWTIQLEETGIQSIITDNGEGIEAQHLQHIFERFYRADQAHSRDIPGTGLGLPLVRSIIQAYGGTIAVDSAGKHQGTRVTVFLPYQT
ncbi:MAG: HAMP domain-containing sensor histidine kinase [Chloroflexota bacterium]